MTRHFQALVPLVAVLAVAACSSDELNTINPFASKTPPPPCPAVNVLADAATLTRFHPGSGQDLIDVDFEAKVNDIAMACSHDIDENTRAGTLEMELQMIVEATRGPADDDRSARMNYFITLTDADRNILSKKTFDIAASFPDNMTRAVVMDEPVNLTIPLAEDQTGRDFQVYLGFQLNADELEYNRRRRALTGN